MLCCCAVLSRVHLFATPRTIAHQVPLSIGFLIEPDILEYEVKWALGSITVKKASGGDGMPAELFQILKDKL